MQNNKRRKVDEWETIEILFNGRESTPKADIGLVIEVKQPIFDDGTKGFPKLGATVIRGDRFLRFMCFDGDISELKAIDGLFSKASASFEEYQAAYDGHIANHKQSGRGGNGRSQRPGGVGGGLSRFSDGEGKTEKRRRKRRENGNVRP